MTLPRPVPWPGTGKRYSTDRTYRVFTELLAPILAVVRCVRHGAVVYSVACRDELAPGGGVGVGERCGPGPVQPA